MDPGDVRQELELTADVLDIALVLSQKELLPGVDQDLDVLGVDVVLHVDVGDADDEAQAELGLVDELGDELGHLLGVVAHPQDTDYLAVFLDLDVPGPLVRCDGSWVSLFHRGGVGVVVVGLLTTTGDGDGSEDRQDDEQGAH